MAEGSVETERSARFLIFLLVILAAFGVFILRPFLTGAVFALVVGYLLQRPQARLARILHSRAAAAALLLIVVVVLVVAPFVAIAYAVADDAVDLVQAVESTGGVETTVVQALERIGVPEQTAFELYRDSVAKVGELAQARVLPTLAVLGSAAANIGVFLFLLYFLLVEGKALAAYVGRAMPLPEPRRDHLMAQVGGRVRALFLGTFLVAILQGTIAAFGWWLFGFPAPIFWGFVMTILAVIPAIGPVLVLVPAGIFAILQGDLWSGLGIIGYGLIVVSFSDNLIRPYIIGRSSGVHPAVVLLGTLGGLIVFGTTGFILGPLVLSMIPPILAEWEALRPGPG